MEPFQERVVTEKDELEEKIGKLHSFFTTSTFAELDPAEQDRLNEQLKAMETYAALLGQRIATF